MKNWTSLPEFFSGRLVGFWKEGGKAAGVLLGAFLLLLTGCQKPEEKADIVILNGAEPGTLDPAIVTVQADSRVVRSLFEGLTRLDPQTAKPIPAMAYAWEVSPDGLIYTFHLRTNAVWSTGEPITAEDVLYSWFRVIDPVVASEYAGQLFYVKGGEEFSSGKTKDRSQVGMRALDAHTFQVELVSPTPFFLDLCGYPTLAVVPRKTIEQYGDRWIMAKDLPTSGPYTLDYWKIRDKIRVRKSPRYWGATNTLNNIVDFLPSENAMTALNIYESGGADIIWDKNLIPTELMDVLKVRNDCHLYDYLGTFFMRFNTTKKPFNDVRVRKAFAMAIDKARITEKITRAGEKVATHFVPNGMTIYTPPEGLPYDPEKARQLLAEAGFPGGKGFPSFQYLTRSGKLDEQVAVELQAMFKENLGVDVEIRQVETKVYFAAITSLDFDIARSSWIGDYNDPNTFLDMFMSNNGNNRTGWKSERYDNLIRQGNRETDVKKREAILQEAEKMLVQEEIPFAPIYYYAGILFFRTNDLDGVYYNLLDEHPIDCLRKLRPGEKSGKKAEAPAPAKPL